MRNWDAFRRALTSCAAAALLAGCAAPFETPSGGLGANAALPLGQTAAAPESKSGKIQHVVIVVQMDRSFNNLFYGYPGAKTASYGYDSKGRKVRLRPISLATTWTIVPNFIAVCNGTGSIPRTGCRMNGFNLEKWTCGKGTEPVCPIKYPPYAYVPHRETAPYFSMADQYVLGDQMYASNYDGSSFGSLQYIISAQADGTRGYPSGLPGCGGGPRDWIKTLGHGRVHPCFDGETLGDEIDAAGLTWAYYTAAGSDGKCGNGAREHSYLYGPWSAYWAIKHICYGPDWNNVVWPETQFLTDVQNGDLRTVSWITPNYANSDHAGSDSATGPAWVAAVVNAIGESKYWDSTAIFVFWDGFGGWFDPEAPRYVDNDGLGMRVPLLVISPYAKQDYVSHVHYEHGSILKFVEDQFGLGRLGASDTRATSPAGDSFDFKQPPRKFTPIEAP
jgi:phospholipase C